jgi:hypothetical protein
MTTPNLGRLTTVPPREVWAHEAYNFTPWVLRNVDVLSDLLGMDLVLDVAEHPVGDFSLDILGRDLADDSVVIVENQLAQSDHLHLGQILTYAAGTNPKTIVWIATGFRPEHRAALDWLNEHTDPDTRFFGVEIEVVRIGDSAPAPNFRLVAEPNDWEKHIKAAASAGAMAEGSGPYWDFWEQFRARVVDEHPDWKVPKKSRTSAWSDVGTGTSGTALTSRFTRDGLRLELIFKALDPAVNVARFEALHAKKDQFEQVLGESATWDEMTGKQIARVYVTSPFDGVKDIDQWPAMMDWLMDQHARFKRAIQAVGGLGSLA